MRKGQWTEIKLDGRKVEAEYLGKGKFSTAYRRGRDVIIYTRRNDCGKEILTHCDQENPHIPECEKLEVQTGPAKVDWDIHVFRMPFYEPIRPGSEAWATMRELERIRDRAWREIIKDYHMVRYEGVTVNYYITEQAQVTDSVREALRDLMNNAANYGSGYMFDAFRRPNLNQDAEGRIILRDVLYDAEMLYNEYQAKQRRW